MKTDQEIQKDVMEELRWEPLLNATEIGVAVKNGVVTLSGIVDTYGKKIAAEEAAKSVFGFKAVAEDIQVKLSSFGAKSDTELAEEVIKSLKWHTSIPDDKIKVKVENGWVTLEGDVEWEYQKNAAKSTIENLLGVKGISNLITVKPSVTVKDIKNKISAAFHRSATVDSEKINIDVRGNKAILSGTVRSWAEKEEAANATWNAQGISSVENNITIDTDVYAY